MTASGGWPGAAGLCVRQKSDYRVVRTDGPAGAAPVFAIHEVFYTDEGVPHAIGPQPLGGDGDAILWTLERMQEAMSRPVLSQADFKR